ncbi:photosynthetic complex assembly protein PuhC [Granulosicoccus sp.]|nr:photosynthetic complex assembly protein PuhC [Granulosicoccus sp.]
MRPGERAILPIWFRTGLVVALSMTLYYSFTHRLVDDNGHQTVIASEHGVTAQSRNLHFVDLPEGAISVIDADNGDEITRLIKGEDGFMRGVMRGFARERKAQGLGPDVPFQLTVWEDGLVSMIDPATERRVELSAFGPDNVHAFTRLLADASDPRSAASSSS